MVVCGRKQKILLCTLRSFSNEVGLEALDKPALFGLRLFQISNLVI